MEIKQAYEVYSLVGGGYNKRKLHGYAWTKEEADILGGRSTTQRYYSSAVHLALVNDQWHRIHVHPVSEVYGDIEKAQTSRIELQNLPSPHVPSIYVSDNGHGLPMKVGTQLEKAIDLIAGIHCSHPLTLYTKRVGSKPPITFTSVELRSDEATQERVFNWLNQEIEARK